MYTEGYYHEKWRDQYGAQMLVGLAYCQIFGNQEIKKAEDTLSKVTEPQRRNLPDHYKTLYAQVESEITSFQANQKPSEDELKMISKIDQDPSDMQSRYDLAKY